MSIAPSILVDKYCLIYCGPERCDCIRGNESLDFGHQRTNRERVLASKKTKFWCGACDKSEVAYGAKCPICGVRNRSVYRMKRG